MTGGAWETTWKTSFFNLLRRSTPASVKYGIIINGNTESSHNKKEKNSLSTTIAVLRVSCTRSATLMNFFVLLGSLWCYCYCCCLIIERGTYILIMFSCKLTNVEKLNTGLLNTTGKQMQLNFPKSNSDLRCHCPKKRFTRKQDRFFILNNFCCCCFFSVSASFVYNIAVPC